MDASGLIAAARRRSGMTQAQLARLAGTSQPVISAYEHGRRDPSVGTLARLIHTAGERLQITAVASPVTDLPPPRDLQEHNQRLLDVLSIADAIPRHVRRAELRRAAHGVAMTRLALADRIVALDRALTDVPHAFGGALALAYYAEPRATVAIVLNVFVGTDRVDDVAKPLARVGVNIEDAVALIHRDGQARVFWDDTPVDLFFAYDAFQDAAAAKRRSVPFADTTIPILAVEHLVVCKTVFNRSTDWVDIDAILEIGTTVDTAEVLRWVGRIAGDDDPRYERIAAVLTRPMP